MIIDEFTSAATQNDKNFLIKNFDRYIVKDNSVRANDFKAVMLYNSEDTLINVSVPILAVSGDKDNLALAENQIMMSRTIANCYVNLLANQEHNAIMTPSVIDTIFISIEEFFKYSNINNSK